MNRLIYFIGYLLRSFHLHAIPSPFVFSLSKDVLREKSKFYAFDEIESIRAKLLLTKKKIKIEDLGAGPKRHYEKSISRICRDSSQKIAFSQMLYRICRESKPESILELGTSLGITTSYLAKACPSSKIISIEGAEEISKIAEINLKKLDIHNVKLVQGSFEDQLDPALKELKKVDLVYFDGNHQYDATWTYFEKCLEHAGDDTVFIFDDIYWSAEMKRVWNKIISDDRVKCSIDLFKIGLVYFNPELSKQNFTVYHSANFNLS